MFDDTDPTHLSQNPGDGDRPDASGDDQAGGQSDFRTLAPGEGGKPPDDGLTVNAPGREGSGKDVGESESGFVGGGGDVTFVELDELRGPVGASNEDGDNSGDAAAGQQGGFRTLAPLQGGNPPDDEKEPSTLLDLDRTKAGDDIATDSAPDIADDVDPDELLDVDIP